MDQQSWNEHAHDESVMRTTWNVLTEVGREACLTHPHRPSHALVSLANGWHISVAASPTPVSLPGQQTVSELGSGGAGPHGGDGEPKDWFERSAKAGVAIMQPCGCWYQCAAKARGGFNPLQMWRWVSADELAGLIERIAHIEGQPAKCLCPDCNSSCSEHGRAATQYRKPGQSGQSQPGWEGSARGPAQWI